MAVIVNSMVLIDSVLCYGPWCSICCVENIRWCGGVIYLGRS
jgi:hypothetical protein